MERCHLWLGRFKDRAEVDDYFEEVVPYPEDTPISLFAADQGKRFYDHDWVFAEFHERSDLAAIVASIRAPAVTRDALLAAATKVGFQCNTVVVADEGEFPNPVSVAGPPRLMYIGCHAFWTHMPSITLFVYGTLMRNRRGHALLAGQTFLRAARTLSRYRLYRRNWYPCLVEDAQGYAIEGELWQVAPEALAALDEYEGAADLFQRRAISVEGGEEAVAYFFGGDCTALAECGPRWDGD